LNLTDCQFTKSTAKYINWIAHRHCRLSSPAASPQDFRYAIELLHASEIYSVDHYDANKLRQRLYALMEALKLKVFFLYVQYLPEIGL
jgi:hypothetical protein